MNEDPSIFEGAILIEREYICLNCSEDESLARFVVHHKSPETRQQGCSWCGKGIPKETGRLRVIVGDEIITYIDGVETKREETISARHARKNNRDIAATPGS